MTYNLKHLSSEIISKAIELARELDDYAGRPAWEQAMEKAITHVLDNNHHGLDTDTHVFFYEQEFYVLSNFSSFSLVWEGEYFATSEHAYHWAKFKDNEPEIAKAIKSTPSAHDAFKLARLLGDRKRPDWEDVKIDIMRLILLAKARQHDYVYKKLIETGDRILVENSWRDSEWGWGPNKDGKNLLGKLWMEVRTTLRHFNE